MERLTSEQIANMKEYFSHCFKNKISSLVSRLSECGLSLIDAVEALQYENEQLKNENASIRNWNACEEKLHNELLESDKRRIELESELEDEENYRAGLEAIINKLRAQVVRMREALHECNAVRMMPGEIEKVVANALSDTSTEYHNPADEEVLKKARCALIEKLAEWISVTERLPEDGRTVLTYTIGGNIEVYLYDSTTYQPAWYAVTHWMPLPKPPKKEDERCLRG